MTTRAATVVQPAGVEHAPVWLSALIGFVVTLAFFYPGFATSDTLAQYQQAASGRYDDVHPPLMAFVWRGLLALADGTAPWFVLVSAAFWSGLARVLLALDIERWRAALGVLVVGLWPAVLLLLGQVWKDVALAAVLLHGAAVAFRVAQIRERNGGHDLAESGLHAADGSSAKRRYAIHIIVASILLAIATALRHNAWPATLPFVWLLCSTRRRWLKLGAASLALLLFPVLLAKALHAENKHVWTTLPVFDLGAISAATGEIWLPESIAPTLTPSDAKQFHRSWSNVALVDSGKLRISFFYPYTDSMREQLTTQWRNAIAQHPDVYAAHRWAVFSPLAFGADEATPRELVYSQSQRIPADAQGRSPPEWFARLAASAWHTPLFGFAPYVVVAAAALVARRAGRRAAAVLLASSLAYALPLLFVAVASEYRYVYWSVVAGLLGIVVSLCSHSEIPAHELAPRRAAR